MTPGTAVGILLPTREAVMSGRPEAAPLLAMAERAEAAGYDSVWVGDSLLARPRFEPLTLPAAAAARTRRVVLGTAVLPPALRHPLLLVIAANQGCYAGGVEGCLEWLQGFVRAGARHIVLRFAGPDQMDQLERAKTGLLPALRGARG